MVDGVWAAGALDTAGVVKFLNVTDRTVRTLARRHAWPRKYLGCKLLYPRALVTAFLESLPDEPPPELRAKVKRMQAR